MVGRLNDIKFIVSCFGFDLLSILRRRLPFVLWVSTRALRPVVRIFGVCTEIGGKCGFC